MGEGAVLTRAYTNSHVKTAKRLLQDLARRLDTDYPSAATSVREGLDETLTTCSAWVCRSVSNDRSPPRTPSRVSSAERAMCSAM